METMIEKYDKIIVPRDGYLFNKNVKPIKTFVPSPINLDYDRSYIFRYFIRKFNDPNANIFEVSDREISKYSNNELYTTVSIKWKISNANIKDVEKMNWKSIIEGREKISNLHLYLPNLTQFYKDIEY